MCPPQLCITVSISWGYVTLTLGATFTEVFGQFQVASKKKTLCVCVCVCVRARAHVLHAHFHVLKIALQIIRTGGDYYKKSVLFAFCSAKFY